MAHGRANGSGGSRRERTGRSPDVVASRLSDRPTAMGVDASTAAAAPFAVPA